MDEKGYLGMCGGERKRERERGRVKCSEEEEALRQAHARKGFVLICFYKEERKIFGVRKVREKEFHTYCVFEGRGSKCLYSSAFAYKEI